MIKKRLPGDCPYCSPRLGPVNAKRVNCPKKMASEAAKQPTTKKGPMIGLSPEEWVRLWDTDFEEFNHGQHDHDDKHSEHHGHSHHHHHEHDEGGHEHEQHTCGSEKYLERYLSRLVRDKGIISILVSLCGNTPDLEFLARQGHDVTGIDVSEKAVKEIFDNSTNGPIPYKVLTKGDFKVFSATDGKKITVYVGDFFNLAADQVGPFDAVWDAHGIISIPEKAMQPYANKLKELLKLDGVMLFSTVNFNVAELTKGPAPCPVSTEELRKFFPGDFEIELLEDPDFDASEYAGVTKCTNPVHLLSHKN